MILTKIAVLGVNNRREWVRILLTTKNNTKNHTKIGWFTTKFPFGDLKLDENIGIKKVIKSTVKRIDSRHFITLSFNSQNVYTDNLMEVPTFE